MKEKLTIQDLIVRIAEKSGMTKKLSSELLRIMPEIIESGLERDGEVRIAGLGTFKLKWVKERTARNLKTGESMTVAAHNKVIFIPEKGLKDKVNEDFKYLTYTVLGEEKAVEQLDTGQLDKEKEKEVVSPASAGSPLRSDHQSSVDSKEEPVGQLDKEGDAGKEEPGYRKRKLIWWVIPLIFVIIALLIVIFYMKNCQDELRFTEKDKDQEQVIKPMEPAPATEGAMVDTTAAETEKEPDVVPPSKPKKGYAEQEYTLTRPNHLYNIARETYGNPFLWSLIYRDNRAKIDNPEVVMPGIVLVIPALEGMPGDLSRSDSSRVADGYRMLYEYYSSKGDEDAKDFLFAMKVYTPK